MTSPQYEHGMSYEVVRNGIPRDRAVQIPPPLFFILE